MRKFKIGMLLLGCMMLVGCGNKPKEYSGRNEVMQSVQNGTYSIESISTDGDARELTTEVIKSTDTDSEIVVYPWVIESVNADDMDESMKLVAGKLTDMTVKVYLGYRVKGDTIEYAFTGLDNNNEKILAYVIQDKDNQFTTQYDDFNNMYLLFE